MAPNGLGLMEHRGALGMSGLHHPQLEETVQLHLRVELLALIATWKDFTFVKLTLHFFSPVEIYVI